MRFQFSHNVDLPELRDGLQQILVYLARHDVERISHVTLHCQPWRGKDLLQAIDENGKTSPVVIASSKDSDGADLGPTARPSQASRVRTTSGSRARTLGALLDAVSED